MGNRLAGKVAIVTGGGTGIGRGIAVMLAREAARVVVAGRRLAPLEEAVAVIRAGGGDALALSTDVTVEAQVEALVQGAVERYGGLDVLVSNAGLYPRRELSEFLRRFTWESYFQQVLELAAGNGVPGEAVGRSTGHLK